VLKSVGRLELPSDIGRRFGELVTAAVENSTEVTRCPVCEQRATLIDGDPAGDWCRVDGCLCGGFFVAADCLEWRLPRLGLKSAPSCPWRFEDSAPWAATPG